VAGADRTGATRPRLSARAVPQRDRHVGRKADSIRRTLKGHAALRRRHNDAAGAPRVVVHRRPRPWGDRFRSYTILIDESEVGSVRNGESASADVEVGHHRRRLKIDWTGSPDRRLRGS
jgi:hypothetical protein